ncbi:Camk/camkl/snrk protein kinase, partial [Globisporangium splendens]
MEVLVLAANDSAMLRLDAVLHALQSSPEPAEILDGMPEVHPTPSLCGQLGWCGLCIALTFECMHDTWNTQQLLDNQLIITRKLMTAVTLAAVIHDPPTMIPRPHRENSSGSLPTSSSSQATASPEVDTAHFLKKISKAVQRVKHLEMEQEQFFEDVQDLKSQYESHATNSADVACTPRRPSQRHQKILWEYLPTRDADMAAIPALSKQIQESETCIGKYPLQNVLGYGQYATVYASSTPEEPNLAIKAIGKDKLIDLVALIRVNSEILSLSDPAIQHPGILAVKDVIHTHKCIYLVTERGGKDLFDHFGVRQEGLSGDIIKPLMQKVAQAVQVLHRHNCCHRDLKPGPDHLAKLIDFGLCTKAASSQDHMLYDFCGSPGFLHRKSCSMNATMEWKRMSGA